MHKGKNQWEVGDFKYTLFVFILPFFWFSMQGEGERDKTCETFEIFRCASLETLLALGLPGGVLIGSIVFEVGKRGKRLKVARMPG